MAIKFPKKTKFYMLFCTAQDLEAISQVIQFLTGYLRQQKNAYCILNDQYTDAKVRERNYVAQIRACPKSVLGG